MNTLQRSLFWTIIKTVILSLIMLIFILVMVEFFKQLVSYNISMKYIFLINMNKIPGFAYLVFPLALLFSICFSLGNLYANNELISVYASGFPLHLLILPVVVTSLIISVISFSYNEFIVINTEQKANLLQNTSMTNYQRNTEVLSAIDHDNNIIYYADYFVVKAKTLRKVIILERDAHNRLMARIDAVSAQWQEEGAFWKLSEARVFTWNKEGTQLEESFFPQFVSDKLSLSPKVFKKVGTNVEELHFKQAYDYLITLKKTGRRKEYLKGFAPLLRRISFPFINLIVALIAGSIGSFFKKNIMIMSLGVSIALAVCYYVFAMLTVLLAQNGYIPSILGAILPEIIFTSLAISVVRNART